MAEEPTRQQRITACLEEISGQPEFPAFSHHIQEVMSVIEDDSASMRRLTNMVLRDFSLTLRVLRMSNSVCYNRSGRPVVSVAHAIALLGTEAIRDLAGSVALFEYYRRISPGLKELMLLSLLTANESRAVAATINYPKREEAYICGMFRNLGEVLVGCYYPRQYAEILTMMSEENIVEVEACLRVLQFTYDELGQAMARHWQLPDRVTLCITPVDPLRLGAGDSEQNLLKASSSFSHSLTNAVYRRDPEGAAARVNLLIQDYFPVLGLRRDDVGRILDTGILETSGTFAALNVPLDELRLRNHAKAALAAETAEQEGEAAESVPSGEELLERLTRDVETAIDSASPDADLHSIVLMILEAMLRGGGFDRVLFCLADVDHTEVRGRLGLGDAIDLLRDRFRIPVSVRGGPIGAALVRRQDLWVASEGTLADNEALKVAGARSLVVLPIIISGILGGCLYCDRLTPRPAPSAKAMDLLSRLRDLTAKAIVTRRVMEFRTK